MFRIFISIFLFISLSHSLHEPLPCPDECLCKALNTPIDALTQTEYSIDCSATTLNKLVYNAPLRIGGADIPNDGESEDQDEDDGAQKDYLISLDLSNTAIKIFSNQTVKLTGFSHQIQALSLTSFNTNYLYWKYHTINVRKHLMEDEQPGIMIDPYAFNSSLLTNIKSLNLSYCCDEDENPFDTICPYLFKPLSKLETLDMSGSDMYKVCLNTPGMIQFNHFMK
ncbi:unnamed protein product [Didymodactylos carnosus]|uniref:Uncharacterized protein n=1 Tax=Didymodactylos carnosus TaxID=1234261 RepID=A0A8S2DNQ2_9BILA|nr:unnamed protein product [Didymodactylos carnosus]CAF3786337.1 unnamed protein product [Didymodactylos carnosus]